MATNSIPLIENLQPQGAFSVDARYNTATIATRDLIPPAGVPKGLQVYVNDTDEFYIYQGADGTNNPADWTLINPDALTDLATFTTDDLAEGTTNLYYTEGRVVANTEVAENIAHRSLTDNPHTVTKAQVGLSAVDNTNDAEKPISDAARADLDTRATEISVFNRLALKADQTALEAHEADRTNPHNVSATQVGLGDVDNTTDADKPVSDLTQTAITDAEGRVNTVITTEIDTVRTDFATADGVVRAALETADTQIRTDFETADTDIRTDFEREDETLADGIEANRLAIPTQGVYPVSAGGNITIPTAGAGAITLTGLGSSGGGTETGSDLIIENENSLITAAATSINFTGEQINATATGNEVDVVLSAPSSINIGNQVQDKSFVELTEAEYDALPVRPTNQVYLVTDDADIRPNFTGVATDITSVNITRGGDIDAGSIIGTRLDIELSDHTVNTDTQLSEAEVQGFIDSAYINGLEVDADTVNGLTVETAVPTDALFTDTDTDTQLTDATILDVLNGATGSIDADLLGNAPIGANVQANWTETDITDDSYIENKPFTIQNLIDTPLNGAYVSEIDVTDGVISITRSPLEGEENVQSDWTETDNTSDSFIQNKPPTIQNVPDIAVIGEYVSEIDIINGVVTIGRETLPTGGATLTEEQVQDIVGDMVSGNVENNIDVTYDDANGKLDFNVTGGGTTPPTTGLTSLTLSTLSFNSFGSNETVTVSGTPGTMFSFSIADTNPIGWLTAGALSVSGTQTIPAGGVYTATLTIPLTTITVNRSARLVATNIANIADTVNSGLFSQIHTAPATAGNLTVDSQIVIVNTTATASVNVSSGDFPVTVELFDVDPAVGTPTAIDTATLTAVGTHTFTAIDTGTLTPGDQTYYVRVSEQAPGTDVVVEIETFTVEAPVGALPPGNVFSNFYSTLTPPDFLIVNAELPLSANTNITAAFTYSDGGVENQDFLAVLRTGYSVAHTGGLFPFSSIGVGTITPVAGTVMIEFFNRDTTPFTSIGTASTVIIDSPNAIPDFASFEVTDNLLTNGATPQTTIWFNTSDRPSSSTLVPGFDPETQLLIGGCDFVMGDVETIPEGGSTVRQTATTFSASDNNGRIVINRPFPAGTLASYRCWVSTVNPPTNAAGTIKYGPVRTIQF